MITPEKSQHIAAALGRLHSAVMLCCGVICIGLVAQVVIWSLLAYTDIRYDQLEPRHTRSAEVVVAEPRAPSPLSLQDARRGEAITPPPDPNRIYSSANQYLMTVMAFSRPAAAIAVLVLVPTIGMALIVGAGAATPGVEKTASAFVWALVVAALTLPLGQLGVGTKFEGVLVGYDQIAAVSDAGKFSYIRLLILPLVSLAMALLVGWQFRCGVRAGLNQRQRFELDPEIEAEASNVKPGSTQGGRAAGALSTVLEPGERKSASGRPPSMKAVLPGDAPKRLI